MKKYHVFGVGNALVDIVTEVSDDFIAKNEVEKGIMTLVEEDRQTQLLSNIDIDEEMMACGGSAANTIIAVSQFGGKSFYNCKVADDFHGKFYLDDLKGGGVEVNKQLAIAKSEGVTGKCLVMVSPDAQRTMNTYLGITAGFSKNEIDLEALAQSEYVYMEGYLVTSPNALEAMHFVRSKAKELGVKTAFTFSDPSMATYFRDQLMEVVGDGVDILFCNEEEAISYTQENTLEEAIKKLRQKAGILVVTRGPNGSMIFQGDHHVEIDGEKVEAIDTNGAGDLYAGAFLFGITQGYSLEKSGELASIASARLVTQFGPRLKSHQAQEILKGL